MKKWSRIFIYIVIFFFKYSLEKSICICRFEKYKYNGNLMYVVVGYMIIYNYYVYLEKVRFRVRYIIRVFCIIKNGC